MSASWAIQLWVEGHTDASRQSEAFGGQPEGALPQLVQRALAEALGMSIDAFSRFIRFDERSTQRLMPLVKAQTVLQSGGAVLSDAFSRKLMTAFAKAPPRTLVIAVWDRDRDHLKQQRAREVSALLDSQGRASCAVLLCVEELEALLLADGNAFELAFERRPSRLPSKPEKERDAKAVLESAVRECGFEPHRGTYARLAEQVSLESLRNACPSFAAFCLDLKTRVAPALLAR